MSPESIAAAPTHAATPSLGPLSQPARRWAYATLGPFVLGASLVWLVNLQALPYVTAALAAYAGLVIALLGGVHWGLAMRQPGAAAVRRFAWGAAAAFGAWIGAMMPAYAGLVVQGAMLVAGYAIDRRVYPAEGLAAWLMLRFRLSAVAALCCFIAAAGA
jgi:hypothetical protein